MDAVRKMGFIPLPGAGQAKVSLPPRSLSGCRGRWVGLPGAGALLAVHPLNRQWRLQGGSFAALPRPNPPGGVDTIVRRSRNISACWRSPTSPAVLAQSDWGRASFSGIPRRRILRTSPVRASRKFAALDASRLVSEEVSCHHNSDDEYFHNTRTWPRCSFEVFVSIDRYLAEEVFNDMPHGY